MSSSHINPDKCIACTICQVYCPVAQVTPNFRGPRLVGPAYERFRKLGIAEEETLGYCANCKNCDIACPHGVPISTLNMVARCNQAKKERFVPRDWVLGHGGLLAHLFQMFPAFLKNFGMLNPVTRWFLDVIGISKRASIPAFSKYFRRSFKGIKQGSHDKKIILFPGCYIDAYNDETGHDIVWVLNKAGYEVIVPKEFSCCGLPTVSNGFIDDARKGAVKNVATINKYNEQNIPIVTGCPSCSLMLNKDYRELFPEMITDDKFGVTLLSDFLIGCVERNELQFEHVSSVSALYHAPCHLRAAGSGAPSVELMQSVGIDCDEANSGCCGISGSYGFKKEKYDIGMEIGKELFDRVSNSDAEYITTECGTCREQIQHATKKKAIHPVTVIRRSLEASK